MGKVKKQYYCPKCQDIQPLILISDDISKTIKYKCQNGSCKYEWTKREIENGELKKIMIVGDTQSGKTTYLASLIFHLIHPTTSSYIAEKWNIEVILDHQDPLLWLHQRFGGTDINQAPEPVLNSKMAASIFKMFFLGEPPVANTMPSYNNLTEEQIKFASDSFLQSHRNGFFLHHRNNKKRLFISTLDIPGEGFMQNFPQLIKTWQVLANKIYTADANLLLIDPKSISMVWQKYYSKGDPIDPINNFNQSLGTISRLFQMHNDWKCENQNFMDRFFNRNSSVWTFAIPKMDILEKDKILMIGDSFKFNQDVLIDLYTQNRSLEKKFLERYINYDFFLERSKALHDKLEIYGEKNLKPGIRDLLNIDGEDILISPLCSYAGHKHTHFMIPSLNVVEIFIHLLKKIGFIEDE